MLEIPGTPAFTAARLEKRLAVVRARNPGVRELAASFAHFVDTEGPLPQPARYVLERLLRYGPRVAARPPQAEPQQRLLVVPRLGTISPWSSKATDIARICGLQTVRRIERGIWYTVAGEVRDVAGLRRALHDRMTESVLDRTEDAARLFARDQPRPLRAVSFEALLPRPRCGGGSHRAPARTRPCDRDGARREPAAEHPAAARARPSTRRPTASS